MIFWDSWLYSLGYWFWALNHPSSSIRGGHVCSLIAFFSCFPLIEGSLHFELPLSFSIPADDASSFIMLLNCCELPKDSFEFTPWVKIHTSQSLWDRLPFCLGLSVRWVEQCPSDSFETFLSSWEGLWDIRLKLSKSLTSVLEPCLWDNQYPHIMSYFENLFPTGEAGNKNQLYF